MYFAHVNANTYMSIFTQRANIHLGLTKCKSIVVSLRFYQPFASYCYALYKPNLSLNGYISSVIGWVGRWCWVASSAAGLTALAYSRARACCACSRCGIDGLLFVAFCCHVVYPIFPFLMPHLL